MNVLFLMAILGGGIIIVGFILLILIFSNKKH